jgi:hypothetical protein
MRIFLPLSIILLFCALQTTAKFVSSADARKVAGAIIQEKAPSSQDFAVSDDILTVSTNGEPVYYVINLSGKGFVIVSADDIVMPVLGYSFEGGYNANGQPVNFESWMNGCAEQIVSARQNNLQPSEKINQLWDEYLHGAGKSKLRSTTGVEPMLTCNWNQGSPYNFLCPADPAGQGGHVYAGCVATAMSQIAYYWRWPLQGTGSHGYNCDNYGYLFADFGNTHYYWNEMTNSINGLNFEMAQLQSHFGIAVDMMYGPDGSGAYSEDAVYALKTYFGYSDDLTLVSKDYYSEEQWSSLMMEQLDAGQPMYYHGFGSAGHAFNLDGYADDLYFHFNWGWGGSSNGYFLLSNLNPGGYTFNYGQGAIINFVPNNDYPYYCSETDTLTLNSGTLEDGSGPLNSYMENSGCGWLIAPSDSVSNLKLTFHRFSLEENHDYLTIYDGSDTTAPVLATLTGQSLPSAVTATGSTMYVRFTSDNSGSDNGWFASYSTQFVNFCPGVTTFTEPSGTFTDGSGNFDYHNNSVCKFKILPVDAQSISLTFNEFNTFDDNDFLLVIDINTGSILYRISGADSPGTLYLNTGKIMLIFKTDQQNTAPGWNITYQSDSYTGIDEQPGTFVSIYPNPACDMLNVSFSCTSDKKLLLTLTDASGREVRSEQLSCSSSLATEQINVAGLSNGIYLLRLVNSKSVITRKVVIE